jgi:hypothetical protein
MGRSSHLRRPSKLRVSARTVLARKGTLRRAKTARPCALCAVLAAWICDGRLRRDELNGDFHQPNRRTQTTPRGVYTESRTLQAQMAKQGTPSSSKLAAKRADTKRQG